MATLLNGPVTAKVLPRSSSFSLGDVPLALCLWAGLGSAAWGCQAAWHWPLVGDAALMHYIVLLLHAGRAPYAQIVDINLPGTYLLEASAVRAFGAGPVGLRLYDGALCLAAAALCVTLSEAGWRSRLHGLVAGLLFFLVHLRDGVVQAGQRDLALAVLVLLALALYLRGPSRHRTAALLAFELILGITLTIKPTLLPLAALPFLPAAFRGGEKPKLRDAAGGAAFLLLPSVSVIAWLQHKRAIPAFLHTLRWVAAPHGLLARKSLLFLAIHSVAPLGALLALGVVLFVCSKAHRDPEMRLLLFGLGCGLGSFFVQAKGFPYQRYPFLLLLLLIVFRMLARAGEASLYRRAIAAAVLIALGAVVAPHFAATIASYQPASPFQDALASDLLQLHAGPEEVQCMDTVGGCVSTLYRLSLIQSTGFLYDCYAYAGMEAQRAAYRQAFLAALVAARPRYIVLTSEFCLDAEGKPDRVAAWPSLQQWLDGGYRPARSWTPERRLRWWHQPEIPPGYILYSLR